MNKQLIEDNNAVATDQAKETQNIKSTDEVIENNESIDEGIENDESTDEENENAESTNEVIQNNVSTEKNDSNSEIESKEEKISDNKTSQLDIFAMMKNMGQDIPDSVKIKEVKKDLKTNTSANKKKATVPKITEPEKFALPISVYYAGFPHEISQEEYPDKECLERKEILHHLQTNFNYRVLTDKRTHLEYDKEKNMIVVHLKNPSKGSFLEHNDSNEKIYNNGITIEKIKPSVATIKPVRTSIPYQLGIHKYSFDDDVIRFVKSDTYGYFIGPEEGGSAKSCLPSEVPGAYFFNKIPSSYLKEIKNDFIQYYPCERLAQIFFNRDTNVFSLNFPNQTVTPNSVNRERETFYKGDYNNILVMEIHSHGDYNAFFSQTDDDNELDFLVYGVIGNLGTIKPTSEFRLGFNGNFLKISIADVFDFDLVKEDVNA